MSQKSAVLWLTALVSAIGAIAMANPEGNYPAAIASAMCSIVSAAVLARTISRTAATN